MISINSILHEHESNIIIAAKDFNEKVNKLESLLAQSKVKIVKKVSSMREKHKKATLKANGLRKKIKSGYGERNQQALIKAETEHARTSFLLENLISELEDIKSEQAILRTSRKKALDYNKAIRKIMMSK